MAERITGKTQLIGLLGTPIRHSNSPRMQNEAYAKLGLDYVYLAFDVGNDNLQKAIEGFRAIGVRGFHVTMPNKAVVLPYLDQLSEVAQLCGSVNTVLNEGGVLIGHNTDGFGFVKNLKENNEKIAGEKMTVIGAGGAATAICAQSALEGLKELSIFGIPDETFKAGERIVQLINAQTDCKTQLYYLEDVEKLKKEIGESSILVNATPVGMGRLEGKSPISDITMFHKELTVVDVIYSPRKSRLLEMAEEQGCNILNGTGMMLWQGAKSFEIWTGQQMPMDYMIELFKSL